MSTCYKDYRHYRQKIKQFQTTLKTIPKIFTVEIKMPKILQKFTQKRDVKMFINTFQPKKLNTTRVQFVVESELR